MLEVAEHRIGIRAAGLIVVFRYSSRAPTSEHWEVGA